MELRCDWPWKSANGIKRNGYDIFLALNDSLSHRALRRQIPGLSIRDESISIPHEQQCTIVVDPIERGYLCRDVPLDEYHDEIIINLEPAFGLIVHLSGLRPSAPSHLDILIWRCEIFLHVLLVLHWIALRLTL